MWTLKVSFIIQVAYRTDSVSIENEFVLRTGVDSGIAELKKDYLENTLSVFSGY